MGVLTPIFYQGEWVGFAANMAHKSDIGGTVPGSGSGNAREIYQEGLHLPPVKFMSRLQPVKEIDAVITANSRTPALVIGDLRGQVGAARLGERRIAELMDRYGKATVLESTELLSALHRKSRAPGDRLLARRRIRRRKLRGSRRHRPHPPDSASTSKSKNTATSSTSILAPAAIKPRGRRIFDRRWCAPPAPIVWSRWSIVFCRSTKVSPARSMRPFAKEASSIRAFPAAVNTYMPTALTVAEAVLRALAPFVPDKRIAGGSGSAALVLGGRDAQERPRLCAL